LASTNTATGIEDATIPEIPPICSSRVGTLRGAAGAPAPG
jgi:hypothetical protein